MGRVVELRGPCRIMAAELVGGAVVRWKCPRCTKAAGRPAFHLFDARTGRLVGEPAGATERQENLEDKPKMVE